MTALALLTSCATPVNDPRIDALMRDYDGGVPGAAVLVLRDGRPVHRAGYGLADLETRTPVTPRTNFRLASVSKQFTARAIEILAERGALSLDDPVTRFLPSLPLYARQITIRQMLTHTSGLLDYEDLIPATATEQLSDLDVLHMIEKTDHTEFPPGTKYRYSNTAYVFLGLVAAKASGMSFPTFLKSAIFEPLGMRDTVMHVEGDDTIAHRAYGHTRKDGAWIRRDQSVTSATLGDGGIYSSIDDLAKWDAAVRLPAVTVATDKPDVRYGFGWAFSEHHGRRTQYHTGETTSFRNAIVRFPDDKLTVVILTNRDDPPPYKTALAIADLFLWSAAAEPPP
jgi:CubicO group peptidase (beta-lactamase class C family)